MNIHLEADYQSYTAFYPTYRLDGRLMAVNLSFNFHHTSADVMLPQALILPQMSDEQRMSLLQNTLQLAERNQAFFHQHDVSLIISVDEWIARTLSDSEFLQHKIAAMPYLELEITEQFPGLNLGRDNPLLALLSKHFCLSLGNYGAGKANSKALFDGIFHRVSLDKGFIQQQLDKSTLHSFIQVIVDHTRLHCQQLVVQGIDNARSLDIISRYAVDGIVSSLFTAVGEDDLATLINPPSVLLHHQG